MNKKVVNSRKPSYYMAIEKRVIKEKNGYYTQR